jgi:hypothetical protein
MNHRIARFAGALLALLLPLSAAAAVQAPHEGLVLDTSRAPQRRGVEVLHPLNVDRAVFERAATRNGAWMPATHGSPQFARMQRTEQTGNGDWTWVGRVETEFGEQAAVITFGADAVFGLIPQRHGPPLRIETRQGRTWLVEHTPSYMTLPPGTDDYRIPPLPTNEARAAGLLHDAASQPGRVGAATATEIDVLLVYNASLVTAYGSDAAARTRLSHLVALANQAYVDSQAAVHVHLSAMRFIDYTATTTNDALMNLMTAASSDPVKTQVDAWRTQYGADLVSFVRHFDKSFQVDCGRAYIGGYHGASFDANYAYSAVGDGADVSGYYCHEYTLAHELGHNMGANHDITTTGGDYGAYTDSRGHRANVGTGGFFTVMAYPASGQSIVGLFSNPALTTACQGQPCGVTDVSNNARTLGLTAPAIAAYRAHVPNVQISIDDASVTEGDSGTRTMTFTVSLSEPSSAPVTYNVVGVGGTAEIWSDFAFGTLTGETIPAGALSKTVSVTIYGDTELEGDETFQLELRLISGASWYSFSDLQGTGTILTDDKLANGVPANGLGGLEGSEIVYQFDVPAGATSVSFTTTGGTGDVDMYVRAGSRPDFNYFDCNSSGGGNNESCASLPTTGPVTWYVLLIGYMEYSGVTLTASYTMPPPTIQIGDASVFEGNSGTKTLVFNVSLSKTSTSAVTYTIGTVNGAAVAGSDYVASTLAGQSIPAGMLSKTFAVTINGDTLVEPHEAFQVKLSAVAGATVADGTGVGMIVNDDAPSLRVGDVTAFEGNSGTKSMVFTVSLSQAAPTAVTYTIGTFDGAALAGSDYVASSLAGQSIPAGMLSKTFAVTINGDTTAEPHEGFQVRLSAATGATIADGTGVGMIVNDDPPSLKVGDASVFEGNAGTKTLVFTVSLSQASTSAVTYTIGTFDGAALAGSDYVASTLTGQTIAAGMLSKTFAVTINGDTTTEAHEGFQARVSAVTGATVLDGTGVGMIVNDD